MLPDRRKARLRCRDNALSSDPEPGTGGAAAQFVSGPAIRGNGDASRVARDTARPFVKSADYNIFVREMLKDNGTAPPTRMAKASADIIHHDFLKPNDPPRRQGDRLMKALEGHDYDFVKANA